MSPKPFKKTAFFHSNLAMPHWFVKRSIEFEYGHHRSAWMKNKISVIKRFLAETLGKEMIPLILTNTGAGAREAIIKNFCSDTTFIYVEHGSSWINTLVVLGYQFKTITHDDFVPDDAMSRGIFLLEEKDIESTVHQVKTSYPEAIVIVDATDLFASEAIAWSTLPIDGCVIVPERSLGGIPGLSIVAIREAVLKQHLSTDHSGKDIPYIFDFKKYYASAQKDDTPYSPDIGAIVALSAAIELITYNGGLAEHIKRQKGVAQNFYTFCAHIGTVIFHNNRATHFKLPLEANAEMVYQQLLSEGISIDGFDMQTNSLQLGHLGHLEPAGVAILFNKINNLIGSTPDIFTPTIKPITIPLGFFERNDLFEISSEEFYNQAVAKAELEQSSMCAEKIINSAQTLFLDPYPNDAFSYQDRTVGFIGAGRTVRETIKRCRSVGIRNFMVFSPSLSRKIKSDIIDDDTLYWDSEGVFIAPTAETIFMSAETVVLLPTYYDDQGAELCNRDSDYVNTHLVHSELLTKIESDGKMDLLINASARPLLIDRNALARHLDKGWLRYISDETPTANDPVTQHTASLMTGHVGGSAKQTKKYIAANTKNILHQLLSEYTKNPVPASTYTVNLVNAHYKPPAGWRIDALGLNQVATSVRILLTDIFDTDTINFNTLSEKLSIHIEIFDSSEHAGSADQVLSAIRDVQPHIMMIRTKTIISEGTADALALIPHFFSLIRPGVGLENMYGGIKALSAQGIKVINEPCGNSSAVGEMTTRFIMRGVPKVILTPGPTPYNRQVFNAIQEYTHYQTTSFKKVFNEVSDTMRAAWLQLPYGAVLSASPSTGLMEAAIRNLTTGHERGFVISHGKFGNRFIDICSQNKRNISFMKIDDASWGDAFSMETIQSEITAVTKSGEKISFFCLQQNETSSGVAYTQRQLQELVTVMRSHNKNCLIILDAVSGLFAHELDFSNIDVDMVITGSQKGLGVSSGLSYATLSKRAFEKMLSLCDYTDTPEQFLTDTTASTYLDIFEKKQQVSYFSLLRLLLLRHSDILTESTSIFNIMATAHSLHLLTHQPASEVAKRSRNLAAMSRTAALALDLVLPVSQGFQSDAVTPMLLPQHIDATELRKDLESRYGFFVSGAQNEVLKPSMLRVGHTGYIEAHDTIRFLRALKILLNEKSTH